MEIKNLDLAEVTEQEWNNRKLTSYGYFSALIDIIQLFAYIAAVGAISFYMIPAVTGTNQVYLWDLLSTIFFINAMKGIFKVTDPINSFQTIIHRKK